MCRPFQQLSVTVSENSRETKWDFTTVRALAFMLLVLFGLGNENTCRGEETLRLVPSEIHLRGSQAKHRILIERFSADDAVGADGSHQSSEAKDKSLVIQSEDPAVAIVENGIVLPRGNGTTHLRLLRPDGTTSESAMSVTVSDYDSVNEWSFRNHVLPILTRQGCNSGACHGALAGKGGFRLSLRGYDPDRDHFNIVHQQQGRRAEPADPSSSLLLTKPTMTVPHKGGLKLDPESSDFRLLAEWIAAGVPGPKNEDPIVERLEIIPERVTLKRGSVQPMIVRAVYSDGHVEDVTSWTKFSSSSEAVVLVDEHGVARVAGPGEGAVTSWFSSRIAVGRVTVPFDHTPEPELFLHAGRRNFIDDLVLKQLRRLNLQPAERCSDEVFIRRAYIDTIGTLPTSKEVREFLADVSDTKRDRLIDQLLNRPEYIDYWTYRWSDVLLINGTEIRPDAVKAYYQWVRKHVENNTPWDQFVRELITSRGSSIENGATNFYALHQAPEDIAENVSQAFLGLSIGCARCHNHPLEKWTNDQYYAFANLFSRVRAKGWGGEPRNGDGIRTLVTVSSGELIQPRTGKPQPPAPLDATPIPLDSEIDRREYLADWLTAPSNSLFARSISNRVWKNFFGVGLVEDVDDLRSSNPSTNEELFAAFSQSMVDHGFNLREAMRTILTSETWQRSSRPVPGNAGDQRYYSRYFPRRMMAEVLLDAVSQVTDVPTEFTEIRYPGAEIKKTEFYPVGTRAIQLYDSAVESYFLQTFGRNQRRITCECERSDEPSMVQVLHMSNGKTVNGKLAAKENRLSAWLSTIPDHSALIDEVFLSCLSRYPEAKEREELVAMLNETPAEGRREFLEDLVWGIISSREFVFNH
jgi:hypothetical protein